MKPERILETCLYVDDLAAAERFYCDVLGLEFYSRQEGRHVFLKCAGAMFLLFNADESSISDGMFPVHGCRGPGHVAFAATADEIEKWRQHLEGHGVAIEKTIDWPQGGRSIYFRDPSGNSIEFAEPRIWLLAD